MDMPRRRIDLNLSLQADSWKEARQALEGIVFRLCEQEERGPDEPIRCTSGGCDSGWHLDATVDTTQTPEGYRAALKQWLASRIYLRPKWDAVEWIGSAVLTPADEEGGK